MRTLSAASPAAGPPPSPWHSPVPYLFGGLAAMLGLIAFALLILACSYCRLARSSQPSEDSKADVDAAEDGKAAALEDKFVVIMAGHHNPTFLATPIFPKVERAAAAAAKMEDSQKPKEEEKADDQKPETNTSRRSQAEESS